MSIASQTNNFQKSKNKTAQNFKDVKIENQTNNFFIENKFIAQKSIKKTSH